MRMIKLTILHRIPVTFTSLVFPYNLEVLVQSIGVALTKYLVDRGVDTGGGCITLSVRLVL